MVHVGIKLLEQHSMVVMFQQLQISTGMVWAVVHATRLYIFF